MEERQQINHFTPEKMSMQYYHSKKGMPLGLIHNGNKIPFEKPEKSYKDYLQNRLKYHQRKVEELKKELLKPSPNI